MTLAKLIEGLAAAGCMPTVDELRDALWLASQDVEITIGRKGSVYRPPDPAPDPSHSETSPEGRRSPPRPDSRRQSVTSRPPSESLRRDLYEDTPGPDGAGPRAVPVLVPAARALPNRLALARALKPLKTRRRSVHYQELHEEATAELTAQVRIALGHGVYPQMRPVQERWYGVHVVLEDDPRADLWSQAQREFVTVLSQTGAFRSVSGWRLRLGSIRGIGAGEAALLESPTGAKTPCDRS